MKAKIFYGPAESGKTRTANMLRALFGDDRTIYLTGRYGNAEQVGTRIEQLIAESTQLIIIDDLKKNFNFEYFFDAISNSRFTSNKRCEPLVELHLPNLLMVFTTNYKPEINDASFLSRFDLIEFPSHYFNYETVDFAKKNFMDIEDINSEDHLQVRPLRAILPYHFVEWAQEYFSKDSNHTDLLLSRTDVRDDFVSYSTARGFHDARHWTTPKFSKALKDYCSLAAPEIKALNPEQLQNNSGRIIKYFKGRVTEMIYIQTKDEINTGDENK